MTGIHYIVPQRDDRRIAFDGRPGRGIQIALFDSSYMTLFSLGPP
jgi:hypothetical protein